MKAITAKGDKVKIQIYDDIGKGGWFFDEISAQSIIDQIEGLSVSQIDVHINSGGGDVFEGVAIYNYLKNHSAKVIVHVDGLAASIASIIAMAGDKIIMGEGAFMMIHDPLTGVIGNAEQMRKTADILDNVGGSMAGVYATKTGNSVEKIRELMLAETWLNAKEAVDLGFATSINNTSINANMAYKIAAKMNAPKQIISSLNIENKMSTEIKKGFWARLFNSAESPEEEKQLEDKLVAEVKAEMVANHKVSIQAKDDEIAQLKAQLEAKVSKEDFKNLTSEKTALEAKLANLTAKLSEAGLPSVEPSEASEGDGDEPEPERLQASTKQFKELVGSIRGAERLKKRVNANG